MSAHWKFEVHVRTPGENEDEEDVERVARRVEELAASVREETGFDVTVHEVMRT